MIQVGARHDEGAPGFGHLGAVHGDEAVAEDGGGLAQAGAVEHGRPEQTVEIDDVLADEVIQLGVGIRFPVVVEIDAFALAQILEAGHVAHRRVHPHVEILTGIAGDFEAEVGRFPGDVPGLQVFHPLLQLVGHAFLQRAGAGPFTQQRLELGQVEEQLGGFFLHRGGAAHRGIRVDQLRRRIGGAAGLAVVAVLVGGLALGAGAAHEPVGQEHTFFRVVELGDGLFQDVTGVLVALENHFRERFVLRAVGAVVIVEADLESGEVALVLGLHLLDLLLRRDAFLFRLEHDGGAVGVIGANVQALLAAQLLKAHPDVGLDVFQKVAQMDRAVGVGQGAGDQYLAGCFAHGELQRRQKNEPT